MNLKRSLAIVMSAGILAAPVSIMAAAPAAKGGGETGPLDLPIEGAETQPAFVTRPSADDMSRFYPEFARVLNMPGRATLHCTISTLGIPEACSTNDEKPAGLGFGKAALSLASIFRLRPRTVDGVAVGGGVFEWIINFALPPDESPEASPPPRYPSPTPRALALARRLAVAMNSAKSVADEIAREFQAQFSQSASGDPEESRARLIAIESVKQTFGASTAELTNAMTTIYAGNFSESELEPIVTFMESSAARAWFARQGQVNDATKREAEVFWLRARDEARRHFCEQIGCSASSPAAKPPAR